MASLNFIQLPFHSIWFVCFPVERIKNEEFEGGGEKILVTPGPSKLEWADYFAVQAECGNLSGNELTRNSSGNARSQSSQLAKPLWTDPGLKSGISLPELISIQKNKNKKAKAGNEMSNILPKSSHARKKPAPPTCARQTSHRGRLGSLLWLSLIHI